jgi:hypothetical protein
MGKKEPHSTIVSIPTPIPAWFPPLLDEILWFKLIKEMVIVTEIFINTNSLLVNTIRSS